MKLYIKYMVSARCKMLVKEILKEMGLHFIVVELGEIEVMEDIAAEQHEQLRLMLQESGLELMTDKKISLVDNIKKAINELVNNGNEMYGTNYSAYISKKLGHEYNYLSNLFSEMKGITIRQFIINQKVEKIKEMIVYDDLNITEIAWKMNYSSVAHLSNQFKKVTGFPPSHFKRLKEMRSNLPEAIEAIFPMEAVSLK